MVLVDKILKSSPQDALVVTKALHILDCSSERQLVGPEE